MSLGSGKKMAGTKLPKDVIFTLWESRKGRLRRAECFQLAMDRR